MDSYVFPKKPKPERKSDEEKSPELLKREEDARQARKETGKHKEILNELRAERKSYQMQTADIPEPTDDQLIVKYKIPKQPPNPRLLNITIIGAPNAGKSTLINRIVGQHISAVSTKAQTTRENVIGIATLDNTQLIFMDTPGIVDRAHYKKVPRDVIVAAWDAIHRTDLIMLVVDCVKTIDQHLRHIFSQLEKIQKENPNPPPAILVLNKFDKYELYPEEERRPLLQRFEKQFPNLSTLFDNVFAISALNGTRVNELSQHLVELAKPSPWIYHKEMKSVQSDVEIAEETVREKIFKRLNQETPYVTRLQTTGWKKHPDGSLQININILVPSIAYLKQITGVGGTVIYTLLTESREDLESHFKCRVDLRLFVKVKKDLDRTRDEDL